MVITNLQVKTSYLISLSRKLTNKGECKSKNAHFCAFFAYNTINQYYICVICKIHNNMNQEKRKPIEEQKTNNTESEETLSEEILINLDNNKQSSLIKKILYQIKKRNINTGLLTNRQV